MQKGRCTFQMCISGITGVQKCRGQGLCPLADSGSQGKKLSVVQEFSGGNGIINDDRTGRK